MRLPLLSKKKVYNPGTQEVLEPEGTIENLGFTIHKFTPRSFPQERRKRLYISCFSEFGCETIGTLYCIPRAAQKLPGMYRIALGWHGREYLYRHLVDEFWELKPENMWLREYCRAFHHTSLNLARLEEGIKNKMGVLIDSRYMAANMVVSKCNVCYHKWMDTCHLWPDFSRSERCPNCESTDVRKALFKNIEDVKKQACRPPDPSPEKMALAARLVGPRPVGVFARGRKCYGRNLPPEFYVRLISMLRSRGYTPIWLGEEATTQPCPVPHITDFSRMPESRDMEVTVAIIKQCEFTVQFWTASTRLAGMFGVPFLLIESPEQLWDGTEYHNPGQEGYRLLLSTFGPKKVAASTFDRFLEDQDAGLALVERCVGEMERGDYRTVFGPVQDESAARRLLSNFNSKCKVEF